MSRNPQESTRFTATGVWARPGTARATILEVADPAPKNETPQQKVKRLREAKQRAMMAQITKWDMIYLYGRAAADATHRAAVYGIIFATGCVGTLAVFSLADMIVYNRRKRAIFLEHQEKEKARILATAREAVVEGIATPAQTALVEGIREEEALMAEKVAKRGTGSKLLWWLHGEWKEDKELAEQRRLALEEVQREEAAGKLGITHAVQEARERSAVAIPTAKPVIGGPLDQAAANVASSAEKTSKGWLGWIWRRSKE